MSLNSVNSLRRSVEMARASGKVDQQEAKLLIDQASRGGSEDEKALLEMVMPTLSSTFEPEARTELLAFVSDRVRNRPASNGPEAVQMPSSGSGEIGEAIETEAATVRQAARPALPSGPPLGPITELAGEALTAYNQARALYGEKKSAEALPLLDKAMELNPNAPFLILTRGYAHFSLGHFEEALADFQRLALLAPGSARGHFWVGETQRQLKNSAGAAEAYRDCLGATGDMDERTFAVASKALAELTQTQGAAQVSPSDSEALREQYELGLALFKSDKFAEAEAAMNNVLAYEGNLADTSELMAQAHVVRGHSRFNQGEIQKAAVDYADARRLFPDNPTPLLSLAECCRRLKWNESARAAFDEYATSKSPAVDETLRDTAKRWAAALKPADTAPKPVAVAQAEVKPADARPEGSKRAIGNEPATPRKRTPPAEKKAEPVVPNKTEPVVGKKAEPVVAKKTEPVAEKKTEPVAEKKTEPQGQWVYEYTKQVVQEAHYEQQYLQVREGPYVVQRLYNVYIPRRMVWAEPKWVLHPAPKQQNPVPR